MNSDAEEESVSEVSEDCLSQRILPQLEENYKMPESIDKYQPVDPPEEEDDDDEEELGLGGKLWSEYEQKNKRKEEPKEGGKIGNEFNPN